MVFGLFLDWCLCVCFRFLLDIGDQVVGFHYHVYQKVYSILYPIVFVLDQAEINPVESRVDARMIHQWVTVAHRIGDWIVIMYLDGKLLDSRVCIVHQDKLLIIDFILFYRDTLWE